MPSNRPKNNLYRPGRCVAVPQATWEWICCCLAHVGDMRLRVAINEKTIHNEDDSLAVDYAWCPDTETLKWRLCRLTFNRRETLANGGGKLKPTLQNTLLLLHSYRFDIRMRSIIDRVARRDCGDARLTSVR